LKHNPNWTAHSYKGLITAIPYGLGKAFQVKDLFYYDQQIEFTREEWLGRIRACRGVGAALNPEQVQKFDREHDDLLKTIAGERLVFCTE
jgi:hypothetical protein